MPDKRNLWRTILFLAATALLHGCSPYGKDGTLTWPETQKMNILHICVEDLSSFAVGCYGNSVVKTPNIDALAERGVLFTRAYCQAPVCNPSRASFCTGTRPDTNRVHGNGDHMDAHVPEGLPFVADVLKQKPEVFTAQSGKLVHKWDKATRFTRGFDRIGWAMDYEKPGANSGGQIVHIPVPSGGEANPELEFLHLPDPAVVERLRQKREAREAQKAAGVPDTWDLRKPFQQLYAEQIGDSGLPEERMKDGRLARDAARTLRAFAETEQPFFLSVGLYATHTPLLAPKKYVDLYQPEDMSLTPAPPEKDRGVPTIAKRNGRNYDIFNGMYPEYGPTPQRQREAIAGYYACASYMDAQIGIILDALTETGLDQNTIIVFFSDHGFHLGEHGCWSKYTLFEQSTRVPMIISVPGSQQNGQVCDGLVELVDFVPTLCDLWDLEASERFEGISLVPWLQYPQRPGKHAAFSQITGPLYGRSVRTERFKYAEYRQRNEDPWTQEPRARELYDLDKDPYEQINLADDPGHAKTARQLAQLLRDGWQAALPGLRDED
jgi:arylsulfatase A-like enzyme